MCNLPNIVLILCKKSLEKKQFFFIHYIDEKELFDLNVSLQSRLIQYERREAVCLVRPL